MIFRRIDLPLKADATSRFLPWIVGVMVGLAALALSAAMLANGARDRWEKGLSSEASVQILPDPSGASGQDAERLAKVMAILAVSPAIESAKPLARADIVN